MRRLLACLALVALLAGCASPSAVGEPSTETSASTSAAPGPAGMPGMTDFPTLVPVGKGECTTVMWRDPALAARLVAMHGPDGPVAHAVRANVTFKAPLGEGLRTDAPYAILRSVERPNPPGDDMLSFARGNVQVDVANATDAAPRMRAFLAELRADPAAIDAAVAGMAKVGSGTMRGVHSETWSSPFEAAVTLPVEFANAPFSEDTFGATRTVDGWTADYALGRYRIELPTGWVSVSPLGKVQGQAPLEGTQDAIQAALAANGLGSASFGQWVRVGMPDGCGGDLLV